MSFLSYRGSDCPSNAITVAIVLLTFTIVGTIFRGLTFLGLMSSWLRSLLFEY